MGTEKTVRIFCSYAFTDKTWLRELETHLSLSRRQGLLTVWHSQLISPGSNRQQIIDMQLETADLILLLVSADFLASDYCYGIEMTRALERHQRGEAQVIPILIRSVDWKHAPFAHLHVLPTNAQPLTLWSDKDAALADISKHLRRVIEGEPLTYVDAPHPVPSSTRNILHSRKRPFAARDDLRDQLNEHFPPSHDRRLKLGIRLGQALFVGILTTSIITLPIGWVSAIVATPSHVLNKAFLGMSTWQIINTIAQHSFPTPFYIGLVVGIINFLCYLILGPQNGSR